MGVTMLFGIPTTKAARRSKNWILGKQSIQTLLGSSVYEHWVEDRPIADARNEICEAAIAQGADYVFMLGDDNIAPPNVILTFMERIGRRFPDENGNWQKAEMWTGVYWTKTQPPLPYLWRGYLKGPYLDWKAGEIFAVDFAGCDALFMSVKMLIDIRERAIAAGDDPRWFRTDWTWNEGETPSGVNTEDYYFYLKARKYGGYRLFCDSSIQCLHEDRNTGTIYGLYNEAPQVLNTPELNGEDLLVAELGCGQDTPYFGQGCSVVRFDIRESVNPDVRCDLTALPRELFGTFDVVHARHVLEHFARAETVPLVEHWAQLLKPGGRIIIRVPNVRHAIEDLHYWKDRHPAIVKRAWDEIYGGQSDEFDFHKQGFTPDKLPAVFRAIRGMRDISVTLEDNERNLLATAIYDAPKDTPLNVMWSEVVEAEAAAAAAKVEIDEPEALLVG
jgi:SAM-dependent methyltransferase